MEPLNSAARLHAVFERANSVVPEHLSTIDMWALVFDLSDGDQQVRSSAVLQRLVWIHDELELLIEVLTSVHGYPEAGYAELQQGIRSALDVGTFSNRATSVTRHLDARVMVALHHIAFYLKHSEDAIPSEQLISLAELLDGLEAQMETASLDPVLSDVMRRHIRMLRRAIDAYPIWGVRAFSDSLRNALSDLLVLRERQTHSPSSPDEQEALRTLKSLWTKVGGMVAEADKVRKGVQLLALGQHVLEWARDRIQ